MHCHIVIVIMCFRCSYSLSNRNMSGTALRTSGSMEVGYWKETSEISNWIGFSLGHLRSKEMWVYQSVCNIT
ncbi:hypothetical protein V1507DRAFT_468476 [Lipomyces tetrasporus]